MKYDSESACAILAATPPALKAWLSSLPEHWVHLNEGPDTWSAYDIVGHLIHGEKTDWIPRARIILAQGESTAFEPFDRFAQFADTANASLKDRLNEFAALRQENLGTLRSFDLSPAEMKLTGVHPEFGEVTLEQLLSTWVVHDLGHIAQIGRVLAKGHRDEVGPWQAYIPILSR